MFISTVLHLKQDIAAYTVVLLRHPNIRCMHSKKPYDLMLKMLRDSDVRSICDSCYCWHRIMQASRERTTRFHWPPCVLPLSGRSVICFLFSWENEDIVFVRSCLLMWKWGLWKGWVYVCESIGVGDSNCSPYYVGVSYPSLSQAARLAQADGHTLPHGILCALTFLWFPRQCFLTAIWK